MIVVVFIFVLLEALRLHPPVGSLRKVCTKAYTYTPKENDTIKSFIIEEGMIVILSLYGLHRDPKYFTDPDCFKPERFLDAKKDSFKYVFMPFGEGQRACLGCLSRMLLTLTKC